MVITYSLLCISHDFTGDFIHIAPRDTPVPIAKSVPPRSACWDDPWSHTHTLLKPRD